MYWGDWWIGMHKALICYWASLRDVGAKLSTSPWVMVHLGAFALLVTEIPPRLVPLGIQLPTRLISG